MYIYLIKQKYPIHVVYDFTFPWIYILGAKNYQPPIKMQNLCTKYPCTIYFEKIKILSFSIRIEVGTSSEASW